MRMLGRITGGVMLAVVAAVVAPMSVDAARPAPGPTTATLTAPYAGAENVNTFEEGCGVVELPGTERCQSSALVDPSTGYVRFDSRIESAFPVTRQTVDMHVAAFGRLVAEDVLPARVKQVTYTFHMDVEPGIDEATATQGVPSAEGFLFVDVFAADGAIVERGEIPLDDAEGRSIAFTLRLRPKGGIPAGPVTLKVAGSAHVRFTPENDAIEGVAHRTVGATLTSIVRRIES